MAASGQGNMRQPGKKKPPRGPEIEDTLCCCEYLDRKGERSHLAACLCECEDLDECCDSSALSFTCVWYCAIVTSGMGYILLIQLFNISYNVTEREARIALQENVGRRLLWGMVVDTGQYNRGFLRNWIQFLTLDSAVLQHSSEDIV